VSVTGSGAQVQITVRPGGDFTPPTVSVTDPADGGSVVLPATVTVASSDNVGVARVELYRNGRLLGTRTSAPYTFPWVDGQSGQYGLYAVAYDTSGMVSVSPTVTVSATQSDTAAPTTPTDVRSVQNTQTSVAAVWTPSTDDVGVVGYQVFQNGLLVGTTASPSYTFTALTCGSWYAMSVAAVDAAGNSSTRRRLDAWTNACTGDTTSPTMPGGLQATATSPTSIRISWQASTDAVGVAGYRVDRNGSTVTTSTATAANDLAVQPGGTYAYTVTAYDANGNRSGTSVAVYITTPAGDTNAPSVPASVTAVAIDASTVGVSWAASTDDTAVAGYKLYRNGVLQATTTQLGYTDTGLAPGTTYTYTVAAYDQSGNVSPQSGGVTVTTVSADTQPPSAPASLSAAAMKGRKVRLTWSASIDNVAVTGYRIYRDNAFLAVMPPGTSFTDSPGRGSHTYHVAAVDAAGNVSADSNHVTIKT
jgi:chitodextrinase